MGEGGGEMKPAIKLWDLIKPPFKDNGASNMIFDKNGFLCAQIRGWSALQCYETVKELQNELQQFIIDAMNEKFEHMEAEK
jgi:hypothetical protein